MNPESSMRDLLALTLNEALVLAMRGDVGRAARKMEITALAAQDLLTSAMRKLEMIREMDAELSRCQGKTGGKKMKFKTLDDLKKQARKDGACKEGLTWLSEQPDLETAWRKMPGWYLQWCAVREYELPEYCAWGNLTGRHWSLLLRDQPQFSHRCAWGQLDGTDWGCLLARQPQFADMCAWRKLKGYDWAWLLAQQPHFSSRCAWRKLTVYDWSWLLITQPQFAEFIPKKWRTKK